MMSPARWATLLAALVASVPPVLAAQSASESKRGDENAWFQSPCLPDSVDDFEWTRYDLHGIRIRVPREVRHIKMPSVDELHFRIGQASMKMRLHRDASQLFRAYYTPQRTRRHCSGDIGGSLAEVISFGSGGAGDWGFAALWADADRGEWLTAVIHGNRVSDVTLLRKTLFTIVFPGERSGLRR